MQSHDFRAVTHHRPDDDEFSALRIIELCGAQEFPGVSEHPLITVDAGLRLSADQVAKWHDGGHVPIGVGGPHAPFDEHGKGDGKSAATCAAKHYQVSDDPALAPMLAYSLRADDRAVDHPFAMATLVKTMHAADVPLERVRAIHRTWFDALYALFSGYLLFSEKHATFQQIAIAWLVSEYGTPAHRTLVFGSFADAMGAMEIPNDDFDELREIMRFVDRDYHKVGFTHFDLAGLVRAMQFTGVATEAQVMDIVATVLASKVAVQRSFIAARAFFKEHVLYIEGCGSLRVAVIRSDNNEMQRAARNHDTQLNILLQVRPDGYMQIFSDQQRDLRPILARLRSLEFAKSGRKGTLSREDLFRGGTHPLVPEWYGFEKYAKVIHIFCGSLKTRRHRKTGLAVDQVVQCIREGAVHVRRARGSR